jgi:hypothetical protein
MKAGPLPKGMSKKPDAQWLEPASWRKIGHLRAEKITTRIRPGYHRRLIGLSSQSSQCVIGGGRDAASSLIGRWRLGKMPARVVLTRQHCYSSSISLAPRS